MERNEAVELIHELIAAEVEVCKSINFRGNSGFIGASKREAKAAKAIFKALIGANPSAEETKDMVEY